MLFEFYPLRFHFLARGPLRFPPGKASNILRGAFGNVLRQHAPASDYARIFEPRKEASGPSGFAHRPRPFVFRAAHLDAIVLDAGSSFYFDLNLFDLRADAIASIVHSFEMLAQEGLGHTRTSVELTSVCQLDESGQPIAALFNGRTLLPFPPPVSIDLAHRPAQPVSRVCVRFLSPTELKAGGHVISRPEFAVLAARIRDRISALRQIYGPGPLPIDFRAFAGRASLIRMTQCDLQEIAISRRSSRTGQTHSIGGFTGQAEYKGDLTEFIPYLRAAQWTGVGRQTVWGKGAIALAPS